MPVLRYIRLWPLVFIVACASPGETMRTQHPDFWNEVVGTWEIQEERGTKTIKLVFSPDLKIEDASQFLCGPNATPHYWTGETPEATVFSGEQAHRAGGDIGKASLAKMAFKRGQFMIVCTGQKMNYEDHILFYGLAASGKKASSQDRQFGAIRSEDGKVRKFSYRRMN